MKIECVGVSGLQESIYFSGLPMRTVAIVEEDVNADIRGERLAQTPIGSGHDNFLNGITVHFLLTATNKFWVEMQRYHFIDFVSSQSTMHKLQRFDLNRCYNEYVDPRIVAIMQELQKNAKNGSEEDYMRLLYSNPSGMELSAYMVTNYRQLKTIYNQRRYHRLKEWRDFCSWIETLPNAEYIING